MGLRLLQIFYNALITTLTVGMLIFASPAEAPADKKMQAKAKKRTIAALQEVEFDQRLERLELCYGVRVSFGDPSVSRRRTCKAIIVHDLRNALNASGTHFSKPLRFHCQSTGTGTTRFFDEDGTPVFRLKPNKEHQAIENALKNHLVQANNPGGWIKGLRACDFYLECQKRLKWSEVNFNIVNRCIFQAGAEGRQLLWESFRSSVFNSAPEQTLMNRYLGSATKATIIKSK